MNLELVKKWAAMRSFPASRRAEKLVAHEEARRKAKGMSEAPKTSPTSKSSFGVSGHPSQGSGATGRQVPTVFPSDQAPPVEPDPTRKFFDPSEALAKAGEAIRSLESFVDKWKLSGGGTTRNFMAKEDKNEIEKKSGMIAIQIPIEVARTLEPFTSQFEKPQALEKLHCTLVFIPDVTVFSDEQRQEIELVVGDVVKRYFPLEGSFNGLGVFKIGAHSDGMYPYWVGLNAPKLNLMQADLVNALEPLGVPVNDAYGFVPHISLGYDSQGNRPLDSAQIPDVKWPITEIHAYWAWNEGHAVPMTEIPLGHRASFVP